jgi:uncharacterized membrane protein YkoI
MKNSTTRSSRVKAFALLGGGLTAGVIGATAIGASAQDTSTTGTGTLSTTSSSTPPDNSSRPGNGETTVTGTKAATLKAAALKQVPGGTVERISTDTDHAGAAYEVHVRKSDGSEVTVLFDANLKYVATETDRGHHGGGGRGGNETAVTGTNATTLKAAARKQVPDATVDEVTTDSGDAAYEVHMTKPDGTDVTVKFDKNLKFVAVEDGRGK